MNSNKFTDLIACGGVFSCLAPHLEILNVYLTFILTIASILWFVYKFRSERKAKRSE